MAVEADQDVVPRGVIGAALRDTWTSLRSVFVNPALRRIELALAGSMIGDWAYATAVVVWAYGVGGARLVGIWGAVRLLLMAFASPIGSVLADRLPRKTVLISSDLLRAGLAVVATICLFIDAPAGVILVVATLLSVVGCVFRPAQMAWMPSLTRRPEEAHRRERGVEHHREPRLLRRPGARGAARVDHERGGRVPPQRRHLPALRGPGGASTPSPARLPATRRTPPTTRTGPTRGRRLRRDGQRVHAHPPRPRPGDGRDPGVHPDDRRRRDDRLRRDVRRGDPRDGARGGRRHRLCLRDRRHRRRLLRDRPLTKNRLAGDLALGTALWSLPLLLVVAYPSPVTVFASAILLGFGNPLVDVNFATIVQRLTPNAVLGRVFGAYEGALIATMALGSAVMPFLISGLGLRWALAVLALVVGVPALTFLPGACASTPPSARPPGPASCAASRSSRRSPRPRSRHWPACSRRRRHPPAVPWCARATCPTASW